MKRLLVFALFSLPIALNAQTKVNYTVVYSEKMSSDGLRVQLTYKTKKAQDSIYFHYYNEGSGEYDLFNCLDLLEEENPTLKFEVDRDSNRIIVRYPKSKKVVFNYSIRQDYPGDSMNIVNRPRMNNAYFHVLGRGLFIVPEDVFQVGHTQIEAKINWVGFPNGYVIHNSFASNEQSQAIKADIHTEFYNSLFVGGDYRLYPFDHNSKSVVFAIRGNWLTDYSDDEKLLTAFKKTIQTQRDFWNDYSQEYYTVIMSPTVSQNDSLFRGQSTTGSAVFNGFMIQSSNNPFNNFGVMEYMFNHEMMHQWIGLTINNRHEELNYWFSEGFTEYYTFKNQLRGGGISLEEWCTLFNEEVILAHYSNPRRNDPNYVVLDEFWMSRDVEKIPYRRGAIFAFWLDNKIMKASNYNQSLDDLMRVLLQKSKTEGRKLTDEWFLEEAQQFLNMEDISYEFQKYIINGEDLKLTSEDLIDCFRIEIKDEVTQVVLHDSERTYLLAD
jgi:predicted metalloprotease with PDZ domain